MTMHALKRGYTLLEMIVAVGIFSVVMLAATGAYLSLIHLDKEARSTSDVANNLAFAVDSMSRGIRTGTNYSCGGGGNCTNGASSFSFRDSSGRTIAYSVSNNKILASVDGTSFPITDPRVNIEALTFYVRGVGTGDGIQPTVTYTIKGSMTVTTGTVRTFTLQSGATQRLLEL